MPPPRCLRRFILSPFRHFLHASAIDFISSERLLIFIWLHHAAFAISIIFAACRDASAISSSAPFRQMRFSAARHYFDYYADMICPAPAITMRFSSDAPISTPEPPLPFSPLALTAAADCSFFATPRWQIFTPAIFFAALRHIFFRLFSRSFLRFR